MLKQGHMTLLTSQISHIPSLQVLNVHPAGLASDMRFIQDEPCLESHVLTSALQAVSGSLRIYMSDKDNPRARDAIREAGHTCWF
eukprot:4970612-Amphidinium_carterae.2